MSMKVPTPAILRPSITTSGIIPSTSLFREKDPNLSSPNSVGSAHLIGVRRKPSISPSSRRPKLTIITTPIPKPSPPSIPPRLRAKDMDDLALELAPQLALAFAPDDEYQSITDNNVQISIPSSLKSATSSTHSTATSSVASANPLLVLSLASNTLYSDELPRPYLRTFLAYLLGPQSEWNVVIWSDESGEDDGTELFKSLDGGRIHTRVVGIWRQALGKFEDELEDKEEGESDKEEVTNGKALNLPMLWRRLEMRGFGGNGLENTVVVAKDTLPSYPNSFILIPPFHPSPSLSPLSPSIPPCSHDTFLLQLIALLSSLSRSPVFTLHIQKNRWNAALSRDLEDERLDIALSACERLSILVEAESRVEDIEDEEELIDEEIIRGVRFADSHILGVLGAGFTTTPIGLPTPLTRSYQDTFESVTCPSASSSSQSGISSVDSDEEGSRFHKLRRESTITCITSESSLGSLPTLSRNNSENAVAGECKEGEQSDEDEDEAEGGEGMARRRDTLRPFMPVTTESK